MAKQLEAVVAVTNMANKKSALSMLTLSAMAIPSVSNAAVVPENKTLSVRYTQYQEENLPAERLDFGSTGRYSIDVLQVRYFTPVKEKYSLDTSVQFETMSGASPYNSQQDGNGNTQVTMSGASGGIEEKRLDASVAGTRYFKEGTLSSSIYLSKENDYQSLGLGLSGSLEINQKHTTLLASFSTSFDELSPSDVDIYGGGRIEADGKTKRSVSMYEGVTQVLDKYRTLQLGIGYTRLKGHLSDPYKTIDKRPETREQTTLTAQYRHYLTQIGAAWHLDYRFYQDDWGVLANTITSSLWKDFELLSLPITLAPNVRYHWQHAADFYSLDPSASQTEQYYSSDFRLSAYGAIAVGLDMQFHHQAMVFNLGVSQYFSAENWGLTGTQNTETPALVNFTTFSLGVDYHF